MADNRSPPLPASFSQGNPPPGYPTQAPQPQQAEQQPVKTQQRAEKGFIEGCLAAMCCCFLCEECC